MEQENFFNEELDFGVEASQADAKEFEAYMEGTTPPASADPEKIKPASEKDKQEEKEKGKAQSDEERAAAIQAAKKKEEEDARKFIEGETDKNEEDDDDDAPKSKASKENEDDDDDDEPDNDFESLAKDLYKVGIFTPDGEEEELPATPEEFIERFNYEKQKSAEQLVYQFAGRHGEEYRDVFNAIFVNGADPKEYLSQFSQVERFKEMDLSDEDNQETVVEAALRNQGWEDDDIKDEIKKLKLNADLESTAARHHKALVKSEEVELTRIEQESRARLERKRMIEQQYSENIRGILTEKLKIQEFDGIPVNRDSANKAVDFLETKKWKLPSGELITDFDRVIMDLQNPQNHAAKVKLALLLMKGYEPGKPINLDLGPVAKKAVSKENNELFNFVKSKKVKGSSTPTESKKKSQFLDGL
jgi:hypothetical protein